MNIKITKTTNPKPIPTDDSTLGFGRIFSDHMFVMNYKKGEGWYDPRIVPYGDIALSPAAMVLHYSQTIFEGMKAYRTKDGIKLFRPEENFKRMNLSGSRMVIPEIPEDLALEGLRELIKIDKDWIPHSDGASLYIRPFVFASDPFVGVRPGEEYIFMIITSPSGPYYATGLNPVGIYVEESYVRAVRGGPGYTKTGGNYAGSLAGQGKYIEEVGAMNMFFIIGDELITPALAGSVLAGITRKSCLELASEIGLTAVEREISIDEIVDAYKNGQLKEAFGTGTAAVVSPVSALSYGDMRIEIGDGKIGAVTQKFYDTLTGIQWGKVKDTRGWSVVV
jgi:branched-chain amino acid aminotransferase